MIWVFFVVPRRNCFCYIGSNTDFIEYLILIKRQMGAELLSNYSILPEKFKLSGGTKIHSRFYYEKFKLYYTYKIQKFLHKFGCKIL